MGGDFLQKAVVSGIAFTVLAAALMMGIAYVGYSSEVMHSNLRRIMTGGLFIVVLLGAVAGLFIYFPHQAAGVIDGIVSLASFR